MAKFTRRSYRRRKLLVGAALFAAVASISTGFASFIISLNAEKIIGGGVNVGTIEDSSVQITINNAMDDSGNLTSEDDQFRFEPKASDKSGRVRADSDGPFENLDVTISGSVSNTGFIRDNQVIIKLELPESIRDAAAQGYIKLPECAKYTDSDNDGTADTLAGVPVTLGSNGEFSLDIKFDWGAKFGELNPCEYYDDHADGKLVPDDQVKAQLDLFYKTMMGAAQELTFTLTVVAEVN